MSKLSFPPSTGCLSSASRRSVLQPRAEKSQHTLGNSYLFNKCNKQV